MYNKCIKHMPMFYSRFASCTWHKTTCYSLDKLVVYMEYFDLNDYWFWLKVVQLIVSAGSLLFAVVMAIYKKKIKFSDFVENIETWIEEAEEHTNYTGAEKMQYVLDKSFRYCTENHIKYSETDIVDKIESLIELSKKVNIRKNTKI